MLFNRFYIWFGSDSDYFFDGLFYNRGGDYRIDFSMRVIEVDIVFFFYWIIYKLYELFKI